MAIFTVTTLADENDAGASVATPGGTGLSLREAIVLANASSGADTIEFAAGLSGQTIRLASTLGIIDVLTIDGDIDNDGTADILITGDVLGNDVVDANGITDIAASLAKVVGAGNALDDNKRIIAVLADLTLDGLTLTGAVSSGDGGAVLGAGTTVTLINSTVSGNSAGDDGGGIAASGVNLTNSTVSANSAPGLGGGIAAGNAIITNSTVSGNNSTGDSGGGIAADAVTLINSTVSGNSAAGLGGGIAATNATITNSTISGNSGSNGGGIAADNGTLTNSTVSGNSADLAGGGIWGGTANLTNATVSGNSAATTGGGINADTANLTNSIVLGNDATTNDEVSASATNLAGGNIVGTDVFQGNTDVGDTAAAQVFAATVDIGGGVLAGELADNGGPVQTIALNASTTNPALDASNGSAPTTDARGEARVDQTNVADANGGTADLGAYELQGVVEAPSLVVTTLTDVVNAFDGLTSLREAIAFADANAGADTITFDAGLNGTIRLDGGDGAGGTVGGTLLITETVTIDGDGRITISGDVNNDDDSTGGTSDITDIFASDTGGTLGDNVRIIDATADLTLGGLTLTGGVAAFAPAGIDRVGGAIRADVVTLTNTTVSGNSAFGEGGGIFATDATLTSSTLSGNSAGGSGGGIFATDATLTSSTLSGNSAGGSGGGISAGIATLTNATVSGNSATQGGGIWADTANLTNTTVSGNSAGDDSGGILATNTNLTNSIVLGNDAATNDEIFLPTSLNMAGGNIVGTNVFQGNTDIGNTTAGNVFAQTVDIDPGAGVVLAGVLADNGGPVRTIALKAFVTNPALDASDNSAPEFDARGETRVDQAGVGNDSSNFADLGAYEARELPSLIVTTLNDVVDDADGLTSLREAVVFANANPGADTITFAAGLNGTIRLTHSDGTFEIIDALTIDGGGRILITGDVANDDTTVGATDITDIAASTAAATLADNVQIINATAGLALHGLTLTGGSSSDGGAVLGTTVTLTNSTVSGNSVFALGGGIFASNTATLINSTVSGNSAGNEGGGIFTLGIADLTNSTISGNSSNFDAGGISALTATLVNSTVSGNSAVDDGGGIVANTVNLTNSILLGNKSIGNSSENIAASDVTFAGGNILGDTFSMDGVTQRTGITAGDVYAQTVDIDPGPGVVLAGVLADNGGPVQTIALNPFSTNPALDSSDNSAPEADARGVGRVDLSGVNNINGSVADIGAYEVAGVIGYAITGTRKADSISANKVPKGQHTPSDGDDVISGRGGNDKIAGLGGDDLIIGGKGADIMRGGDGEDIFQFNSLAELKTIQTQLVGVGRNTVITRTVLSDHIKDFVSGEDHLDFANMDADSTTAGLQSFTLIGSAIFSGNAGELRFVNGPKGAVVSGDVNGDGKADFKLLLDHATIAADDFTLFHT